MSTATGADSRLRPFVPAVLAAWDPPAPDHRQMEGTLVFADVSGFTRLTERLASRGRMGAEEMVTTISSVWTALLGVAGGGDVLKFAGDALVLFFHGPDHVGRACAAALDMQRVITRAGRVPVGRSVVRLRMSIGVHTDEFPLLVVGDSHLELLVVGRPATTTVEMEELAPAGRVLVSPSVVDRLAGAVLGEHVGAGRVLESVPESGHRASPDEPARPATGLDRFVSPLLRDRLGGELTHEHRRVAIGFAQVGGIDDLVEQAGPAEALGRLHEFTAALQESLLAYDVLLTSTDLGRDGVVYMMSAGAPDSLGDEATRMLRVGREIAGRDGSLRVRVGANVGSVFAGEVGPAWRRAYVTMGDTTNLAARTMARAPWGALLATRGLLDEAGDGFSARPVDPFTAKGKRKPVEAAVVEAIRPVPAAAAARVVPMVGRDEELRRVLEAWDDARNRRGRVVEIVGEEGSGRSRLVAELREALDGGVAWHAVRCDRFERANPYRTARLLLRDVLGIPVDEPARPAGERLARIVAAADPALLPWLPLMSLPIGVEVEDTPEAAEVAEQYRRVRAQQVIADLIDAAVAGPAVGVIEDASYIDDASAELIADLLARIAERSWLVLVTRTGDESGLHHGRGYPADVIELGPLSQADSAALAMRLAESMPVPRHMLDELVGRSGGSPLFLAELMAQAGTDAAEMPHTVEGMLSVRIDALPPADRRALRLLSVLGERFDSATLDAVLADYDIASGDGALWERLSGWVDRDEDQFGFANPLTRQVAYEGLPYRWRKEIHARVAAVLPESRKDELPVHLARAELWDQAWAAARAAGDRARAAGANAVAGELYDLALQAVPRLDLADEEVLQVAGAAGLVWSRAGLPERALAAYGLAISHCTSPPERLLLEARRAAVYENSGRYPQALRAISRALAEADRLEDPTARHRCRGVLLAGYASTRHRQGRHAEAADHVEVARAEAEAAGDLATLAQTLHLSDRIHTALGHRDVAARHRDAALPVFAELGDFAAQGTVLHDLAADAQRAGRLEEAGWLFERAIEARTRAGDVVRAAASINAIGEVELALGRPEEAASRFTEALRIWRGARSPEGVAVAATNLGSLRLRGDDSLAAVASLEEAERLAQQIGAEGLLATARLGLAEAYLRLGRAVEAWERATAALDAGLEPAAVVTARMIRAEALGMTGGADRALAELSRALEVADGRPLPEPGSLRGRFGPGS